MSRWLRCRVLADRAIAGVLLFIASPLVAIAGWLVRREDGGPAFIQVPRVGVGGHTFGMWKLRSMRAEQNGGTAKGPTLTQSADPRITRVGAHLRKFHIDEVPQLVNVCAGQMSLIGPRPESPDYVELADPHWKAVLGAPPGILGPTQIIVGDWELDAISDQADPGRYVNEVLPVKLAIDTWYLGAASPLLDALTLVSLIIHLIPGRRARWLTARVARDVPPAGPACRFSHAGSLESAT